MTIEERVSVLESVFEGHVRHHDETHDTLAEEITRRETEINRRLDEMNRFRQQISEERGEFVQRDAYDERHEAMNKRVVLLELANSNLQGRLYMVGAVVSVIVSLVVVAVNMVIKLWK